MPSQLVYICVNLAFSYMLAVKIHGGEEALSILT